ncbi:DUF5615 family PIN-like protein [Endozoicomonas acroporae]|uniref:DUF5615 family PIN-like protein n=1 Tax=Endozoicomonas TaxID=305899 RepID=UPI000C76C86A|nr:DUF5615 family PIN-like protein [Endozoicomonas acroporae]
MLLFDENLSYKLARMVSKPFRGAVAVSRVATLGEGASDQSVWDYAKHQDLAIVTKDRDFVDYWSRLGPPPKVIHIQIGNARLAAVQSLIMDNQDCINQFLAEENSGLLCLRL